MSDVMLIGVLRMPVDLWSDTVIDKAMRHGRYTEAADKIEKMTDVLEALQEFNRLRNDTDCFLRALVEYALGREQKPNREDYGV